MNPVTTPSTIQGMLCQSSNNVTTHTIIDGPINGIQEPRSSSLVMECITQTLPPTFPLLPTILHTLFPPSCQRTPPPDTKISSPFKQFLLISPTLAQLLLTTWSSDFSRAPLAQLLTPRNPWSHTRDYTILQEGLYKRGILI